MEGEQPTDNSAAATDTGADSTAAVTGSEDNSPEAPSTEAPKAEDTSALIDAAIDADDDAHGDSTVETPAKATDDSTDDSGEDGEGDGAADDSAQGEQGNNDSSDPKEVARQAFERREAERQSRKSQAEADQQKYVEAAEDEQDEALRQLQVEAYNNRVDRNTNSLINGFEKAQASLDVFQNPTPQVQAILDDAIDEFQARFVTVDKLGNPTEVRGDIHQFLSKKAEQIRSLQQTGAIQEKSNNAKVKGKAMTPPARTPAKAKVDPIMAVLDSDD